MKLGDDRIVVIDRVPRLDAQGKKVRDDYGNEVVDEVPRLVRWCLVTPTSSSDSEDRQAPARRGAGLLAPTSAAPIADNAAVLWPVAGPAEGPWTGLRWQVAGEALPWPDCIEATLRRVEG